MVSPPIGKNAIIQKLFSRKLLTQSNETKKKAEAVPVRIPTIMVRHNHLIA
jgi:hypothetical protein